MAASVVIIEERTGQRRKVELVGGALPLQGANWSGLQLLATSWNPGNTEATQQVLGPQLVPSDWDFEWNTTRILRTPVHVSDEKQGVAYQLTRAHELATLLRNIFEQGALLKVSWISNAAFQSQSSPRQVRLGRAETWDMSYDRPDDVIAGVSFAWIGFGEGQPKASAIRGDNLGAAIQEAITASNEAANAIAEIRRADQKDANTVGPTTFSLGDIEAIANGPLELVDDFARKANGISNRLKRIGELINTVKETPAAIAGRLVDVANNGVAVANQFVDTLTREGPETQSLRNKVNVLTKNASYFSGAQTHAGYMADIMEKLAEAARRRQNGLIPSAGTSRRQDKMRNDDNFAVHVPRPGDTMASIAQKYYGAPDLGDELAVANGLPAYTIEPPRMPIIIPTRRNLEEANRNRL